MQHVTIISHVVIANDQNKTKKLIRLPRKRARRLFVGEIEGESQKEMNERGRWVEPLTPECLGRETC